MPITTIADMQIVPEKFSKYVVDRTTERNSFINSGIASADPMVEDLINGTPEGGRFINLPMWNALDGEEDVFGEDDVSVGNITTKEARATLLIRQRAWGSTDLAHVLGGADPMGAIAQLIADWRNTREQKVYLSILKAILDPTNGALKAHINDISSATASSISNAATLDTKQALGDSYGSLSMMFIHSATYTYLQKNELISRTPVFDPTVGSAVEIENYLGYRIVVDDGMPVTPINPTYAKTTDITIDPSKTYYTLADDVYTKVTTPDVANIGSYYELTGYSDQLFDTYFLGAGAFIRQDGTPKGFVGTETDRDKIGSKNYLINRWCQVIHPRGLSWISNGVYTNTAHKYPANVDLANPANWELTVDHKKVPIACLRHKLS